MGRGAILLLDAGPLIAYVDADDPRHGDCLDLLTRHAGPLAVPILVVAEVAYVVGTRLGSEPEVRFLADLATGAFATIPVENGDWLRIAELVARYRDLPLGTVDASIVAAAERLGVRTIATLDRRDFGVVRPVHTAAFELVP
jgi:predicted nucleic acid-binding protein